MALGLYAIFFYVFNLSFLDNSVKTLLFLQKFAFYLNDPSLNSRVMRIGRACDALMDKLSKRPAQAYCSRKRSASSKANSKHVAPATPACEVEVDTDMPDRRPGTSKSKPRLPVSVAPATLDSDVAHPTKRAKSATAAEGVTNFSRLFALVLFLMRL